MSHPTMGAWIEMFVLILIRVPSLSHPTMGAWIEITIDASMTAVLIRSLPTMGAWIEIICLLEGFDKAS